jgi:hypothetical protein
MKQLLFAMCALAAAGAAAGSSAQVRRHVGKPQRTDCPSPWCEQTPSLHRLIAPDDPALYLGDVISYERPSDWRHFAPLAEEVSELTAGLTSDLAKITAVANWLKHAKVAASHEYTSWPPSIIDLWGFPEARCEEASFLLTAMLRLTGIPAMRFSSWNNDHEAVRAFADGTWIVVDATPLVGDNSGPARIYTPDDPAFLPAFQERPIATLHDVVLPGTGEQVDTFTLFDEEPLDDSDGLAAIGLSYGRVAFPVTNEFLAYDHQTSLLADNGQGGEHVAILFRIELEGSSCFAERASWYATPVDFVTPTPLWRTIDRTQPPRVGSFYPLGVIETILPTCGTWRIVYYLTDDSLNAAPMALAYAEFDVGDSSRTTVIRPGMLQPVDGADPAYFQALVNALERVPSFEAVGGSDSE